MSFDKTYQELLKEHKSDDSEDLKLISKFEDVLSANVFSLNTSKGIKDTANILFKLVQDHLNKTGQQ
jgi:hypothetical protein